MVACTCDMNPVDKRCTNTPQTCYDCCAIKDNVLTCVYHFHLMGRLAREERLRNGWVHASIREATDNPATTSTQQQSPSPGESDSENGAERKEQTPPTSTSPAPTVTSGLPASTPPRPTGTTTPPTATALAAMQAVMDTDRATAQVATAALQARIEQLARQARDDMAQIMTLLTARAPAATAAAPEQPSPASSPHRSAVLGRTGSLTSPVDADDVVSYHGDDQGAHEVPTHTHTRRAILPAAFVPLASGTEQSAQQQLAAILSGLTKQSKTKYANFNELNEALNDWATSSMLAGWTAAQVESIRAYQAQLITHFAFSDGRPLKDVLEYHRLWCKAVDAGTIDMFAPGAELNQRILHTIDHPLKIGAAASTLAAHRADRPKDTATSGGGAKRQPAAKYPAGSCIHHKTSTHHTTAECSKNPANFKP